MLARRSSLRRASFFSPVVALACAANCVLRRGMEQPTQVDLHGRIGCPDNCEAQPANCLHASRPSLTYGRTCRTDISPRRGCAKAEWPTKHGLIFSSLCELLRLQRYRVFSGISRYDLIAPGAFCAVQRPVGAF